jgi:hypothetical protein
MTEAPRFYTLLYCECICIVYEHLPHRVCHTVTVHSAHWWTVRLVSTVCVPATRIGNK